MISKTDGRETIMHWTRFVTVFAVLALFVIVVARRVQISEAEATSVNGADVVDTTDVQVDEVDQQVERAAYGYQVGADRCVTAPYTGPLVDNETLPNCQRRAGDNNWVCCPCDYTVIYQEPWCFHNLTGKPWGA